MRETGSTEQDEHFTRSNAHVESPSPALALLLCPHSPAIRHSDYSIKIHQCFSMVFIVRGLALSEEAHNAPLKTRSSHADEGARGYSEMLMSTESHLRMLMYVLARVDVFR